MTESGAKDEAIEIANRNYEKITKSLEKEGFREGVSAGRNLEYQKSFDKGYEDGFKIGLFLGNEETAKSDIKKNCAICQNESILASLSEKEIRGLSHERLKSSRE